MRNSLINDESIYQKSRSKQSSCFKIKALNAIKVSVYRGDFWSDLFLQGIKTYLRSNYQLICITIELFLFFLYGVFLTVSLFFIKFQQIIQKECSNMVVDECFSVELLTWS